MIKGRSKSAPTFEIDPWGLTETSEKEASNIPNLPKNIIILKI